MSKVQQTWKKIWKQNKELKKNNAKVKNWEVKSENTIWKYRP